MLALLLIVGLGPILWLAKSAVTPTQDTLRTPMALWPHGIDLDNLATAWNRVHIDRYFGNTLIIAAGSWFVQIVVATTGGYALSVLRPRYAPIITGLVLATLFVPAVVLLVPLYLTVLDTPLLHMLAHQQLLGRVAAGRRERPQRDHREALLRQPAAGGVRGGPHRWRGSVPIVLVHRAADVPAGPGCRLRVRGHRDLEGLPVAAAGAARPRVQPLSVRLPTLQRATELDVFLAALAISTLIPIAIFLVLQRMFLRGAGLGGAVKG